jgi:hypothetical protein
MTSKTVAMWIVMDVSGHYEVATDEAVARRRWLGRFGGPFVEKNAAWSNSILQCLSRWNSIAAKTNQTFRST